VDAPLRQNSFEYVDAHQLSQRPKMKSYFYCPTEIYTTLPIHTVRKKEFMYYRREDLWGRCLGRSVLETTQPQKFMCRLANELFDPREFSFALYINF
jgi:hypothetical protein